MAWTFFRTALLAGAVLLLGACAGYDGRGLRPGESNVAEVEGLMGVPAMRWKEADGGEVLVYPRGPAGYHTYMARIGPDGRLLSLENVLEPRHFARVMPGMTQERVLHVLGPPYLPWTVYFRARNELVWEWRYCDDWSEPARFHVYFDSTTGLVRTTGSLTESQQLSIWGRDWCSR